MRKQANGLDYFLLLQGNDAALPGWTATGAAASGSCAPNPARAATAAARAASSARAATAAAARAATTAARERNQGNTADRGAAGFTGAS